METRTKKGFTLIELSIVLVIIGLLVGGVMGGQSLLQQAKIYKTASQLIEYERLIETFKMQYNGLPGDIAGDKFWDCSDVLPDHSCTPTNLASGIYLGDKLLGLTKNTKGPYVWLHLRKAGLIAGSLDMDDPNFYIKSPLDGVFATDRWALYIYNNKINYLIVASKNSAGDYNFGFITPKEAFMFDSKFDDGKPASGKILIIRGADFESNSTACVNKSYNVSTTDVDFLFEDTRKSCRFFWRLDVK